MTEKQQQTEEQADHLRAGAEHLRALTAREQAERARVEAETREALARARKEEHLAEMQRILAESAVRSEAEVLATDKHHHVYLFDEAVSGATAKKCINQLNTWHRTEPGCEIEIRFWSPGGSVVDGLALYDSIQDLRRAGHKITTAAYGMAASMAGILLQAGDVRVMTAESWILIHEGSFGVGGSVGQVEDTVAWVKRIQKRILAIFASRSHLTTRQIEAKWRRTDWWLDSAEALKLGLIDVIR